MVLLPATIRFPNQDPFAPSITPDTSKDRDDNVVKLGIEHRSPGI
jgi:hypothetical protein